MIRLDYVGGISSVAAAAHDPKAQVDYLVEKVSTNFRRYALGHPFMKELATGQLSIEQIRGFVLNWYTWTFEINMATATWLYRFGSTLKAYPDIAEILHQKIADELITPTPRGHIKTLETLGAALGSKREELINARLIPEARAWLDYFVRLVLEGTFAEGVAGYLGEGCFPEFAWIFQRALTSHYGLSSEDVEYFRIHGEQDALHGQGNATILLRLIEVGRHEERPGWGLEYVSSTGGQLFVSFLDGVYRRYNPEAVGAGQPAS